MEKNNNENHAFEIRQTGGKFLTFFLDTEEYGMEILKVQEIIGMMPVTRVPRTPDFIRGVINLRGKVIPVMDLRTKLGMISKADTEETCIIVSRTNKVEIGIIVDRVSEVMDIAGGNIDETPSFGAYVNTDYILGMGKANDRVKIILDMDKILSPAEAAKVEGLTEEELAAEENLL